MIEQPDLFAASAKSPASVRPKPSVALSIRQPWAWLILHGGKDIENRQWSDHFRGYVFLHAAKGMSEAEWLDGTDFAKAVWRHSGYQPAPDIRRPTFKTIDRGGIVGVAKVVGCVSNHESPWFVGPYGFVLKEVRPLPFHPCRGDRYFFPIDYPTKLWEQATRS
jgi:hypothetical protein